MAKAQKATLVIRRESVEGGGHHGGAWKVAYADFVTALMAFFLLLWLLNATTEQQRRGIADYFSAESHNARSVSGDGEPLSGTSPFTEGDAISDRGSAVVMHENAPPVDAEDDGGETVAVRVLRGQTAGAASQAKPVADAPRDQAGPAPVRLAVRPPGPAPQTTTAPPQDDAQAQREEAALQAAAASIRRAIAAARELDGIAQQIAVDMTPEGLRIQIRDDERRPMFASGSSVPNERAQAVLRLLAPVLASLPEQLSIAGYTDASPYSGTGKTNWDLSADRANATRSLLQASGLADGRIRDVTGRADRDLLLPAAPLAAANRRITVTVLRGTR